MPPVGCGGLEVLRAAHMPMRIWKHTVPVDHEPRWWPVSLPVGARIVDVAAQAHGWIGFWSIVDPEAPTEVRDFQWIGTGWEIPEDGEYRGTCHVGGFVWHLFEATA